MTWSVDAAASLLLNFAASTGLTSVAFGTWEVAEMGLVLAAGALGTAGGCLAKGTVDIRPVAAGAFVDVVLAVVYHGLWDVGGTSDGRAHEIGDLLLVGTCLVSVILISTTDMVVVVESVCSVAGSAIRRRLRLRLARLSIMRVLIRLAYRLLFRWFRLGWMVLLVRLMVILRPRALRLRVRLRDSGLLIGTWLLSRIWRALLWRVKIRVLLRIIRVRRRFWLARIVLIFCGCRVRCVIWTLALLGRVRYRMSGLGLILVRRLLIFLGGCGGLVRLTLCRARLGRMWRVIRGVLLIFMVRFRRRFRRLLLMRLW